MADVSVRVAMFTGTRAIAAAMFLVATATADEGPPPPVGPPPIRSEGCETELSMPTGSFNHIIMPIDDPLLFNPFREYYVYLPEGYTNRRALPVVYSYHGFYSSAPTKMQSDKFIPLIEDELPNKQKFIVVYGQGSADCNNRDCTGEGTWNTWGQSESPGPRGHTCNQNRERFGRYGCFTSCRIKGNSTEKDACFKYGKNSTVPGFDHCHASTCANDTLYADLVMKAVEKKLCVDRRRQYVTGMSVGGMMALWMASHFSARFAAAIPVAGSALMGFWKDPVMPIPLMDIHGTEDKTIPANYSNGFVGHGANASALPLVVPGCPDCSFSDDGFYYTSNYNITRGIALSNNCSCTVNGAHCKVKPWKTLYDNTVVGNASNWTCFESYGDCGRNPIVRCTWSGKHYLPVHGNLSRNGYNVTIPEKKHFFAHIAWEFFSQFYIEEGSEKERLLLDPAHK